jgi:hypothetical protein
MLHSFGRILVVINEVAFLWRKKKKFFFFLSCHFSLIMEELQTTLPKCVCCRLSPQILFKVTGPKIKDNKYIVDFIEEQLWKNIGGHQ